ncbi:MAG TPA: N-acetylmuramoyl-L-alanine amidase [Beijerinckiaceae bacterium]|nr:N-acetylmuramoyl-L-alanine amidase [Beijerinckiaceae bacterium]
MTGQSPPDSPIASRVVPSPNQGERRDHGPDMLILHYTGMPDERDALRRLCSPDSEVSAHYVVFENGEVVQLVPEARRAWHAGAGFWGGVTDINSCSIGIEIANPGHDGGLPPFPPQQIAAVIALAGDIVTRWSIRPQRVLAHSDVAPGRKQDPGERFPWQDLHRAGIGHWIAPAPISEGAVVGPGDRGTAVEEVQAMLAAYGYGAPTTGAFDSDTKMVVAAFQRHFRPERVDGVADPSTVATLRALIASRPS